MAGCAAEEVVFDGEPRGGVGSDIKQIADLLQPGDDEHLLRDQVWRLLALGWRGAAS